MNTPSSRDSASTRAFTTTDPERQGVFVGMGRMSLLKTLPSSPVAAKLAPFSKYEPRFPTQRENRPSR